MGDNRSYFSLHGKKPIIQLIGSLLIILLVGMFLFSITTFLGTLIFDVSIETLKSLTTDTSPKNIPFLRYLVITQDITIFILPGVIILTLLNRSDKSYFPDFIIPGLKEIFLVIILALSLIPIISFTGELNSGMHFPDWLSGVEQWMQEKEDSASGLIDIIIPSKTFGTLMLNLLTLAVIPAIGEELIFRGVFQKILTALFKSGTLAIWLTAFFFSAMHFQFFGFIPRVILGLIFGYLYFWSGTLWLPVISHFVNNAVPVIVAYLYSWDKVNVGLDTGLMKQFMELPVPIILSLVILFYLRKVYKNSSPPAIDS